MWERGIKGFKNISKTCLFWSARFPYFSSCFFQFTIVSRLEPIGSSLPFNPHLPFPFNYPFPLQSCERLKEEINWPTLEVEVRGRVLEGGWEVS